MNCRTCDEEKPADQMSNWWSKRREVRLYGPDCKTCRSAKRRIDLASKAREATRKRERYASDPEFRERFLDTQRKWRYGITRERFDAIMAAQGGGCAICGTATPDGNGWHVDHDHTCCGTLDHRAPRRRTCGKCTRGILCNRCNLAIGRFRDDPDVLLQARAYLLAHKEVPA